jgi:hypothetical protein
VDVVFLLSVSEQAFGEMICDRDDGGDGGASVYGVDGGDGDGDDNVYDDDDGGGEDDGDGDDVCEDECIFVISFLRHLLSRFLSKYKLNKNS